MDDSSKPRYDQAPENFSESGQRANRRRNADQSSATNQVKDEERSQLSKTDIGDGDNITRGEGSTVESLYSCYSLAENNTFLREEGGRNFSALNRLYYLPADSSEWTRVEKVVFDILKPEYGVSKEILDIGCGSGIWAIEMSRAFPHLSITGVDLVPPPIDPEQMPDNFQAEVDDINLGLTHFYGRFDLVHMRCVYPGLKDYQKTLHEVQRCLKPGGIVLVLDNELESLDEQRRTYIPAASDDNPEGSWYQKLTYEFKHAVILDGGDKAGTAALLDKGFWDDEEIDPTTCGTGNVYFPIGPWATSPNQDKNNRLQFTGVLMRQILLGASDSCRIVFRRCGVPQAISDEWLTRAQEELRTIKFKGWLRYRMAWGRRRAGPSLPAPPLSVPDIYIPLHLQSSTDAMGSSTTTSEKNSEELLPQRPVDEELDQVEVYRSKEESLEVARRRYALRKLPGPSLVARDFPHPQQSSSCSAPVPHQ